MNRAIGLNVSGALLFRAAKYKCARAPEIYVIERQGMAY